MNKDLLISGAAEAQLPSRYQKYLQSIVPYSPPPTKWGKLGATLFLLIWAPVMRLLEKITNDSIGPDGNAHWEVVWLVRLTMHLIWLVHDYIFAPIFGRGDGTHQTAYGPENFVRNM